MPTKRAHVVLSEQLLKDIDTLVGMRQRSSFITQAAEEKLMRLRQIAALKSSVGAWKDIDALNAKRNRGQFLLGLVEQGHILACCPINVAEVYAGLKPKEEERTEALLQSLKLLPITFPIAQLAGLLKRDYGRKGKRLSIPDTTIAAVAIYREISLVTDTIADFPMPNLMLHQLPKSN